MGFLEAARRLLAAPTAPVTLCRRAMETMVRDDERFCWSGPTALGLREWRAEDRDLADLAFVAIDLETTGAGAGRGKITEIGAVRIEGLREVSVFQTLVNPMRAIPPFVVQITGITQEMVRDAPRIEEVLGSLMEFLDGAIVVAHNAGFDLSFLNYELGRTRGRRLAEGAFDTLTMSRTLVPGLPNYRLQTVADALGAPVMACHRALEDARAAAHVFTTLVGRLQERGVTRLSEARALVSTSRTGFVDKLALTEDLPKSPGTYLFLDAQERVLYAGKADRLRERVRSHFCSPVPHSRALRQAIRLVQRVHWEEAESPLEAVIREQDLIQQHRPPCNVFGSRPETYLYVKAGGRGSGLNLYLTPRPGRACLPLALPEAAPHFSGPLVLGPFRGRRRAHAAVDLLARCYPIRRCPGPQNGRPCVRHDTGKCLGPCSGLPERSTAHDVLVAQLMAWLMGEDLLSPDPLERADSVIAQLSQQHRYEDAQSVRDAREDLASLRRSYQDIALARRLSFAALWCGHNLGRDPVASSERSLRLNVVLDGALHRSATLDRRSAAATVEAALAAADPSDTSTVSPADGLDPVHVAQPDLDRLLAIRRWYLDSNGCVKIPLPTGADRRPPKDTWTRLVLGEALRLLES